ncbi:WD40-repeat-containing domain protein [Obelidium mucronatum]|nr:WD40-repeat-containing domain protein [Obelidium mucronatum]
MDGYSLPGVLHFLNTEWRRFERERNEWTIEKEALKAQVALLLGEKRALETLNTDLTRRSKMLEFALKNERKKHSDSTTPVKQEDGLSSGEPTGHGDAVPDSVVPAVGSVVLTNSNPPPSTTVPIASANLHLGFSKGLGHARSREILKNYLREANYLLSHANMQPSSTLNPSERSMQSSQHQRFAVVPNVASEDHADGYFGHPSSVGDLVDDDENETEESELRFRARGPPLSEANGQPHQFSFDQQPPMQPKVTILKKSNSSATSNGPVESTVKRKHPRRDLSNDKTSIHSSTSASSSAAGTLSDLDDIGGVSNGAPNYGYINQRMDDGIIPEQVPHTSEKIWKPKATLNSHLDSIRSIEFLPTSSNKALISCSEDGTAKLWSLQSLYSNSPASDHRKTITPKADLEPVFTFRGHAGAVTALAVTRDGEGFYTGGIDSSVRFWSLKDENGGDLVSRGTYASYGANPQKQLIVAHTDTVWDMQLNDTLTKRNICLATASADGTVKIFDASDRGSHRLLSTIKSNGASPTTSFVNPTSVRWVPSGLGRTIAVAYQDSGCRVYDVETGKVIVEFQSSESYDGSLGTQINDIAVHPTLPLLISAHEDRFIRLFDINTGACVYSMLGHVNSVTSITISPTSSGLYFASGGHDCSLRWWDIGTRTCIQEYSTHRKKDDEGIWDVSYHPTSEDECFASAGADGVVKLFSRG